MVDYLQYFASYEIFKAHVVHYALHIIANTRAMFNEIYDFRYYIFVTLSLLGLAMLLRKITRWPSEFLPFIIVSLIICILYISAFLNILNFVSSVLYYVGLFAFLASLFEFVCIKHRFKDIKNSPYLMLSFMLLMIAINVRGYVYSGNDEFSNWGLVSKVISDTSYFPTISEILHPEYPPGSALFQYYAFCQAGYSEGMAYFSNCILQIFPLVTLIFMAKNWMSRILSILFILSISYTFGGSYSTLYIDTIIGCFFGGILLIYLFNEDKQVAQIQIAPCLFALSILKSYGFDMCLILIILFVVVQYALIRIDGERCNASR